MAPLYCPTQARSAWMLMRSFWPIEFAVSAGDCSAGRTGTVATCLDLAVEGGVWACAEAMAATNINVAVSIDLMTTTLRSIASIDASPIKHICWVGTNG